MPGTSTSVSVARLLEAAHSTSPFLQLPAELRNLIYDFTAEDNDLEHPVILSSSKNTAFRRCNACAKDRREPAVGRSFYSLTQVCREIRNEYLPLYRARTKVHVYDSDILKYVETTVDITDCKPGDVIANVAITTYTCGELPAVRDIYLIPLMQLEAATRKLSISFALRACSFDVLNGWPSYLIPHKEELLNQLLDSNAYPKLRKFIEERAQDVRFILNSEDRNFLNFTLNERYGSKKGCTLVRRRFGRFHDGFRRFTAPSSVRVRQAVSGSDAEPEVCGDFFLAFYQ
ncbi:hypothetical protein NX059_012006 [Plenodomus lindquistii]|nr:hypothetical protein NX059_012006 [Plenodomus lindquistii]